MTMVALLFEPSIHWIGVTVFITKISIENFRGISTLEWSPPHGLVALVGPGDSCKTSILDAMELALSPRWNPTLSDNDFFQCNTELTIKIEVTVGNLPEALLDVRKFGLHLRGITDSGDIADEPAESDEPALTIRFLLDSEMEPTWTVINDRLEEPRTISARDRSEIGLAQIGGQPNTQFTWNRGSAIMAATSTQEHVNRILADAQRAMRKAVSELSMTDLQVGIEAASDAAVKMGAGQVARNLGALMSADSNGIRGATISLHSDGVPIDRSGLGTRRLVAIGLQELAVRPGAIILVDEIESGLEPYRLRHLIRVLRERSAEPDSSGAVSIAQTFLTTHSPVTLEELGAGAIHVVRRLDSGEIMVCAVDESLQSVVRSSPESFLARRILVCEGKTELGLITGIAAAWTIAHDGQSLAHMGVVLSHGAGAETGIRAVKFNGLGYPVLVFADSDIPLNPTAPDLESLGISSALWGGKMATETRISIDLPWTGFIELYAGTVENFSEESVRTTVAAQIGGSAASGSDPQSWLSDGIAESEIRTGFASAAKSKSWFKRINFGIGLGELIVRHWEYLRDTPLMETLNSIEHWVYDGDITG
jgi:hypothetical protein